MREGACWQIKERKRERERDWRVGVQRQQRQMEQSDSTNSLKVPLEIEREKERGREEREGSAETDKKKDRFQKSSEKTALWSLESICSTDSFGFEGRLNLQPLQTVPVDPAEERMFPDLPLRVRPPSKTLGRVFCQELGYR